MRRAPASPVPPIDSAPSSTRERTESISISIGTWNVEYAAGADRNLLRLARLRARPADLWILTETHDDLDLSDTHRPIATAQRPTGRVGGRWTTIWSRWPVLESIPVEDPVRTIAALIDGPEGPLAVYGTVLPWHSDGGPGPEPARSWSEQDRVLPKQLAEWGAIRSRYGPQVPLVVAGDLNMNLGGKHYYGTARGRTALRAGMAAIGLGCATAFDRLPEGALQHSPIDHILVPEGWLPHSQLVAAWEGTDESGRKLSDHSGLVVQIETEGLRREG